MGYSPPDPVFRHWSPWEACYLPGSWQGCEALRSRGRGIPKSVYSDGVSRREAVPSWQSRQPGKGLDRAIWSRNLNVLKHRKDQQAQRD